jgi:prefoldin subunit 5
MAAREAAGGACEGCCPYHSGHEEQLTALDSSIGELKAAVERTDERLLKTKEDLAKTNERLVEVSTTVKVGAAVGASVGAGTGVLIGLLITWLK